MPITADTPNAATCWLRVEGVNHSHFIFDTNDLSTIRGGGMLLLEAIDKVKERILRKWPGSEAISSGASTGLFKVPAANPAQLIAEVRQCLGTGDFSYASFVVAVLPESGNFEHDRETLIAMNRYEQMTMPSLQLPATPENTAGNMGVCAVDRISPATGKGSVKKTIVNLSASVHARRETGKDRKHTFYKRLELQAVKDADPRLRFAKEFSEIAEANMPPNNNTEGKIAVFYADGNSFGTFQRTKDPTALSDWDDYIKAQRKNLLDELIQPYLKYDQTKGDEQVIPFETLLWGGDEMLFVVPADKGLNLAKHFFEATQDWAFTPKNANKKGEPKTLSHALGLVFCHSNAPIKRIIHLAQALAEQAKADSSRTNALNIAVLKSFDHTGSDWAQYINRRYQGRICTCNLLLDPVRYTTLLTDIAHYRQHLPRGRLYDYLHSSIHDQSPEKQKEAKARFLHDLNPDTQEKIKLHTSDTPEDMAWWALVGELWDFVPEKSCKTTTAQQTEGASA